MNPVKGRVIRMGGAGAFESDIHHDIRRHEMAKERAEKAGDTQAAKEIQQRIDELEALFEAHKK